MNSTTAGVFPLAVFCDDHQKTIINKLKTEFDIPYPATHHS